MTGRKLVPPTGSKLLFRESLMLRCTQVFVGLIWLTEQCLTVSSDRLENKWVLRLA
jgi:hypothetical protein